MTEHKFKLGEEVKDTVTGWQGIAISRIEFLNGCVQYGVKKKTKKSEAELKGPEYIDDQQLVRVGPGVHKEEKKKKEKPGGDFSKDVPRY